MSGRVVDEGFGWGQGEGFLRGPVVGGVQVS